MLIAVMLFVLLLARPAGAGWCILLNGVDVTQRAMPIDRADMPLVNASNLAEILRLRIDVLRDKVEILDATGARWQGQPNTLSLLGGTAGVPLALRSPLLVRNAAVFLPLDAVAALAGLQWQVPPDTQCAQLTSTPINMVIRDDGWESFTLVKPTAEQSTTDDPTSSSAARYAGKPLLPINDDVMRADIGIGYVQGADYGMELTGDGKMRGIDVQFNALLTQGDRGTESQLGRLSLEDDEFGWGTEIGNLCSDLWGGVEGFNFRWRASDRHWRSLAVYSDVPGTDNNRPIIAYRDEVALSPTVSLGGEFASDRSMMVKARFQEQRTSIALFGRWMSANDHRQEGGGIGDGAGIFLAQELGHGFQLYGSFNQAQRAGNTTRWTDGALRFPLWCGIDLMLEHTHTRENSTSSAANAAMLTLPVGPLRLLTRFQSGESLRLLEPSLGWSNNKYQQLMASTLYAVNPRLSFDYQVSTRWQQDNPRNSWSQLVSAYQLSPRTQLQMVSNFPNMLAPEQLQVNLQHQLRADLAIDVKYGQLQSYQGVDTAPERGFMVMLRTSMNINTPSRGGEVRGIVTDQARQPIAGIAVTLGEYRTVTDAHGVYRFPLVPQGNYALALDVNSLPANTIAGSEPTTLHVTSRTRKVIDLTVVPLASVRGHVYIDTNGNGCMDSGEGIEKVALALGSAVTASDTDGAFRFDNVAPGVHDIRIVTENLPSGLMLDSPEKVTVVLAHDQPAPTPTFCLKRIEKPIIFQALN